MSNNIHILALQLAALPTPDRRQAFSAVKELICTQDEVAKDKLLSSFQAAENTKVEAYRILEICDRHSIKISSVFDLDFPINLDNHYDPPLMLFYKGNLKECLARQWSLAIVGSRNADRFGVDFSCDIANNLGVDTTIISGLALGIDSAAHQGALQSKIPNNTIAVLAHGLDTIYPIRNHRLSLQMLDQGGCLVSQYPPGVLPRPHQFLVRNAIISALSQAVLVVQAGIKSGSLATARHALDSGKDVMALPGRVDDPRAFGTNRLIQQGAHLIRDASDVRAILGNLSSVKDQLETFQDVANTLSDGAAQVYNLIRSQGQVHYHELIDKLADNQRIQEELLQLELDGLIKRQLGNYFSLARL